MSIQEIWAVFEPIELIAAKQLRETVAAVKTVNNFRFAHRSCYAKEFPAKRQVPALRPLSRGVRTLSYEDSLRNGARSLVSGLFNPAQRERQCLICAIASPISLYGSGGNARRLINAAGRSFGIH